MILLMDDAYTACNVWRPVLHCGLIEFEGDSLQNAGSLTYDGISPLIGMNMSSTSKISTIKIG